MPKSIYIPKVNKSNKNQTKQDLDFSKVLADVKWLIEWDESANFGESQENQHLAGVLAKIANLVDWNLWKKDIDNIFEIFWKNFENRLKINFSPEQLKSIRDKLWYLIDNTTFNDEDLEQQVSNLYVLLWSLIGWESDMTIDQEAIPTGNDMGNTTTFDINSTYDLYNYESDIEEIKSDIDKYMWLLENKKEYEDLVNSLDMIKEVLDNPKYKNISKLQKFLDFIDDKDIPEFDWYDLNPIISWLKDFVWQLKWKESIIDNGGQIIEDYEKITKRRWQEKTRINGSFHKFIEKLNNNQIESLNELSDHEIDDIMEFIWNENNKDKALDVHLTILNQKDAIVNEQISHVLDEIKWKIETIYEQEEIWQWELDEKTFVNIDKFFKSRIAENPEWNWQNLDKTDPTIKEKCIWHEYSVEQFVDRFDIANQERIEKNKDLLKNIIITDKISEITMKKIGFEGEKLVFSKSESLAPEELTQLNLVEKLGITKGTIWYIKWALLVWNEFESLIHNPDITQIWLDQIIAIAKPKIKVEKFQKRISTEQVESTSNKKEETEVIEQQKVDNVRDDLNDYISDKQFPWKAHVQDIVNEKNENKKIKNLKLLQLLLIPYYDWHIDWLLDQDTLDAIKKYVEKNLNTNWENIIKSEDPSVIWCDSNWNIINDMNNLNTVVKTIGDKNLWHVYFLDYEDFEYSIEDKTNLRATVGEYNYVYDIGKGTLQKQKGDDPEIDVTNEYVLQWHFKTIVTVTKQH